MLCIKVVFCFCFDIQNNFCTQHELVFFLYWSRESMNNLSSYCGLTDSRMSASDTDLPVPTYIHFKNQRCLKMSIKLNFYLKLTLNFATSFRWTNMTSILSFLKNKISFGRSVNSYVLVQVIFFLRLIAQIFTQIYMNCFVSS